jgi:SMC interacting uncharacterized protein involved in chromosome segregation
LIADTLTISSQTSCCFSTCETESRDVISDMESLRSLIEQKDDVINELQCNNSSLLKMLETKSVSSSDKTVVVPLITRSRALYHIFL